jgi:hypothetical protein
MPSVGGLRRLHDGFETLCSSKDDRDKWSSLRVHGIGGSEVGKVLGLVPYGDPHKQRQKLFEEKVTGISDFSGNASTWVGNTMADPVVTTWLEREGYTKLNIEEAWEWECMLRIPSMPWLFVTPDWGCRYKGKSLLDGELVPIEIKCVHPDVAKQHWDVKPPKHVVAQAMLQAWVIDVDHCNVVQWHMGAWPKLYRVDVKEPAIEWMLERLEAFWVAVTTEREKRGIEL